MNRAASFLVFAALFVCSVPAMAADKVVVVPLGSSAAKGSDGQVQYNDNGKTAGAELYYDKTNRRLEARGEMRTTDGAGNPRLWGRGRPGTGLYSHSEVCPSMLAPTRFALSKQMATWEGAAEVCPVGKWVCTSDELPTSGTCNVTGSLLINNKNCVGTSSISNDYLEGWVADAYVSDTGVTVSSNDLSRGWQISCYSLRVWCCWKNSVVFPPFP